VKYAAFHGASFGGLRYLISSKLSKHWRKNDVFGPKMTVFSKLLAGFQIYGTLETTKRCAMQSCIFHIPSSKFSNQYWWTKLSLPVVKN
jgi:hypothetical protein